jgi:NADP-dependent 3-hydroxy acid dehydrogenase YdfG
VENNNSKVAIVTGVTSGIGYATSLALSKAGIRVAVGATRSDRLHELEEQIVKNGDEGKIRMENIHAPAATTIPLIILCSDLNYCSSSIFILNHNLHA